jgi:hypothetical protein
MTNQWKAGINSKRDCMLGSGGWSKSAGCPIAGDFDDGDDKHVPIKRNICSYQGKQT